MLFFRLSCSASAVAALEKPYDDKVVYNFHSYDPLKFTHQGAYWTDLIKPEERMAFEDAGVDEEYFEKMFGSAIEKAKAEGTDLYCGEYGCIDIVSPEDTLKWYKAINKVFEKYGISRSAWSFRGMDFGLCEPRLDSVREELLKYF